MSEDQNENTEQKQEGAEGQEAAAGDKGSDESTE